MTALIPIKHSPFIDCFLFQPHDLGTLFEVINEDQTVTPVLVPGTFIHGLWHSGSPVLDPARTIEPDPDPAYYAAHGCSPPIELKDTP